MRLQLIANLDYVINQGGLKGLTIKQAIDKDYSYVQKMKEYGGLKLSSDALCYLINKRNEHINKLSKFCDIARRKRS